MTQMSSLNTGDQSRKRPRSASNSSSTSDVSSPKRAASDSPAPAIANRLNPTPQPLPASSIHDEAIDEYMQSQGEGLSLADATAPTFPVALSPGLSPADKLRQIQELKTRPLKVDDTWYIVSRPWYRNWESACGGAPAKGAPDTESQVTAVDNSPLAGSRPNKFKGIPLEEGVNIELLPQEAWDHLVSWYGTPNHTFARRVIAEGVSKTPRIEFYPINFYLYLCRTNDPPPPQTCEFSKTTTLDAISDAVVDPIRIQNGGTNQPYRIWKVDPTTLPEGEDDDEQHGYTPKRVVEHKGSHAWGSWNPIVNPEKTTLEEALISDGDRLIIEQQEDGDWKVQLPTPAMGSDRTSTTSVALAPLYNLKAPSDDFLNSGPLFGPGADFFGSMEASSSASSSSYATPIVPGAARKQTGKAPANGVMTTSLAMVRTRPPLIPRMRGTIGLNNLGNTCFMSSALQCLAHLPELTEYFLNNVYQLELNPGNPLSTGGELARSYGSLLQNLFDATATNMSVAPRDFKLKISRHAPSFSGYAQHDSQELLAFLLDGLHEDLNRILKKPYVENPDWQGGGDKELVNMARTFWTGYKKRNDSVIVDLFQGQYKSTLVCPECEKVSITFDPFMYLTLPLPFNKSWEHEVYFVTWDVVRPNYKTRLNISRNSTFRDIKVLLSKWFDAQPDNLLAAEIFSNRIYKFFPDYQSVSDVADNDVLFFYELPVPSGQSINAPKPSPTDLLVLPVYTVTPLTYRYALPNSYRFNGRSKETLGYPFFVAIPPEDAGSEEKIYEALVDRYQQATNFARDLYTWQEEEDDEDDAVMVTAPQSEVSSVNGDPIGGEKDAEGDDDMEEVKLPSYSDIAPDGPRVVRGAPKPELFSWMVMANNFDASPQNSHGAAYDTGDPAKLARRLFEAETDETKTGMLRPKDGIVCEWDESLQTYYFGSSRNGGEQARWNETETYVDPVQAALAASKSAKQKTGITLEDCLDEFVKEEMLGEADLWYCPRCKKHQQATKKFDIWKVPDVLVVHLKRFSNSRMLRDKIDVLVNFPTEGLDLGERVEERVVAKRLAEQGVSLDGLELGDMEEPMLYDLFAVDEHMGGLGGGHYRAYAKNADDGKWYHFDDARVEVSTAAASVTPYAYLLFYRRRTARHIGGDTVEKIQHAKEAPPEPVPEPQPVASSSRSVVLRPVKMSPMPFHSIDLAAADDTPETSPRSSPPSLENDLNAVPGLTQPDEYPQPRWYSPSPFEDDVTNNNTGTWPADGRLTPSPILSSDEFENDEITTVANSGSRYPVDEDYDGHEAPVQEIIVEEASAADPEHHAASGSLL